MELDWAKVYPKEMFKGVHVKVFETSSVVFVQKVGELTRRLEFLDGCFFSLAKKSAKLVASLLEMVKMGILLDSIYLQLFDEVLQLLYLIL